MCMTPGEYATQYRISFPSMYPTLRADRGYQAQNNTMGRLWRILDSKYFKSTRLIHFRLQLNYFLKHLKQYRHILIILEAILYCVIQSTLVTSSKNHCIKELS